MSGTVEPKCPSCDLQGVDHISHIESSLQSRGGDPWFDIVFCGGCGHVYGVFAKVTLKPTVHLPSMPYPAGLGGGS